MYSILPKLREDMQLRGFSKHTIRSYTECVTEYLSLLNKPLSATIANTASTRPSARSKPATSTDRIGHAHGALYHHSFSKIPAGVFHRISQASIFLPDHM